MSVKRFDGSTWQVVAGQGNDGTPGTVVTADTGLTTSGTTANLTISVETHPFLLMGA